MDPRLTIRKSIKIGATSNRLLLVEPSSDAPKRRHNLICVDASGDEVWAADLPAGTLPDGFVDARIDNDLIRAHTWSGWEAVLDGQEGKTIALEFTK